MMHKRPELDTVNPPGQIVNRPPARYLRDVIARINAEERKTEVELLTERVKFLEGENERLRKQIVKDRERFVGK